MDNITEWARQRGKCPDRYYYQMNGKSVAENYIAQKNEIKQRAEIQTDLDKEVKKQLDSAVEMILKQIMR